MKKVGLTAHCLIRNEERWIWYALNSVIDHVDKILVFDTGSTDRTVEIVKTIKSSKIVFEEKGMVNKKEFAKLRQEMLIRTRTAWFMVLDGDEVWPKKAIVELVKTIHHVPNRIEAVVVGQWVCQGDVFHFSREVEELHEDKSGRKGFWLPRAWRVTPGLHANGTYGVESYADDRGVNVSYWPTKRLAYLKSKFLHMSFLPRSTNSAKDREVLMRAPKRRYSIGEVFPQNFKYPEVFYKKRPYLVSSPWKKHTWFDSLTGVYYRALNLVEQGRRLEIN